MWAKPRDDETLRRDSEWLSTIWQLPSPWPTTAQLNVFLTIPVKDLPCGGTSDCLPKRKAIMSSTEKKRGNRQQKRRSEPLQCRVRLKWGYVVRKYYHVELTRIASFHELDKWNIKMPTNSDPYLIDTEQNSKSCEKEVVRPRDRAQSLVMSDACWMASCPSLKGNILHSWKTGRLGSLHYPLQLKKLYYLKIF